MKIRPLRQILSLQGALVALIPFAVMGLLTVAWLYPEVKAEVAARNQALARSVAEQVEIYLDTSLGAVQAISNATANGGVWLHDVQENIDAVTSSSRSLRAVYFVGPDGGVLAAGLRGNREGQARDLLAADLSRNPLFQQMKKTPAPTWSDTFLSVAGEGLSVAVAVPAGRNTVFGEVDLRRLSDHVLHTVAEADEVVFILDRRGQVIADKQGRFTAQQLNIGNIPFVRKGLTAPAPATGFFEFRDRKMIGSLARTASVPWLVLVARPVDAAYSSIRTSALIGCFGFLTALAAGVAASVVMSRRLAGRFETLAAHARRIAQGDAPEKWPSSNVREFRELGTDLRRMADAVRERERRLGTLMANLPGMVYRCAPGPQRDFVLVSEGCLALTGYPPEELAGASAHNWSALVHPDDRGSVEQSLAGLGDGRSSYQLAYRICAADGGVKWVWDHAQVVRSPDGEVLAFEGFATDVTERHDADAMLLRLAAAIEHAGEEILFTDELGFIRYVNPALERSTGYSGAELLGQTMEVFRTEPADREAYREAFASARGGRTWSGRYTATRKDGHRILCDASIAPIRDADNRTVGFVATQRDVTAQVDLERHATRSQQLEAIGTLAGGIAHDFNNILSAIVGYTELALMKEPEGDLRADLEAVLTAAGRATELVRQILAFSRMEHHGLQQTVRAAPVVEEALKLLRASIPTTIEIRPTVFTDASVSLDPSDVHRVLVNLCTNAALSIGEREGVIDVELTDVYLDEEFARRHPRVSPGPFVRMTVRDSGCGMPPEVLARIFEPFFTTRPDGQGTGMGLSVVHGVVTKCNGAVTVSSEPGQGTTFEIFLPAAAPSDGQRSSYLEHLSEGRERVLFVDDEKMIVQVAQRGLEKLGYRVAAFEKSADALAAFLEAPGAFDVVVTDMTMPRMTGVSLAEEIRGVRPDLPIILCTGYSKRITRTEAAERGIDEFLMKPVSMSALSEAIRRTLKRRADLGASI